MRRDALAHFLVPGLRGGDVNGAMPRRRIEPGRRQHFRARRLAAALAAQDPARANFDALSPSNRRAMLGWIAMAKRLVMGVRQHTDKLATGFYDEKINFKGGDFLKQKITMQLFREEQILPGMVIDRDSTRVWKAAGSLDAFGRAILRVNELLASYRRPELDPAQEKILHAFMLDLSQKAGLEQLPILEDFQPV